MNYLLLVAIFMLLVRFFFVWKKLHVKNNELKNENKVLGEQYEKLLNKTEAIQKIYESSEYLDRDTIIERLRDAGALSESGRGMQNSTKEIYTE